MAKLRVIGISRWLGAAVFVALAQSVIAPNHAQASCGDYVMLGRHAVHYAGVNETPVHRRPCSGPNCREDSRPLETPAAPVEIEVRHWGLIAAEDLRPIIINNRARFTDDTILLRIAMGAVFRPPR